MNQPNRAQRRQMERDGLVVPPGGVPNLGAMNNMPDMPTLGEQRRSAALQLALQAGAPFEDADEFIEHAVVIERYLVDGATSADDQPSLDLD